MIFPPFVMFAGCYLPLLCERKYLRLLNARNFLLVFPLQNKLFVEKRTPKPFSGKSNKEKYRSFIADSSQFSSGTQARSLFTDKATSSKLAKCDG